MTRALFLAITVAALGFDAGPAEVEKGLRPAVIVDGRPEVKYTLADRMRQYKTPAVSVAVIREGKIQWAKAWGELAPGGRKADAETVFQAASISKPVAALAAMHMTQYGNFVLDEDVNLKLKTWKVPESEFGEKVTLRRLLSHSAGLTVHGFRGYAAGEEVPSTAQILNGEKPANSAAVRVNVEPGSIYRYSGGGYTVMQQLLVDKSGMEFPVLMQKMVLGRIGMKRSTYEQPLPPAWRENAARGFRGNGDMVAGEWHRYPEMAAAGLWTTPSDLALFLIEVRKAARGESNVVIEKATALEMLNRQKGDYGLGFGLTGEGDGLWFGHGGANDGYRCEAVMNLGSGDGIVVMTNSDAGSGLGREIIRGAAVAYGWAAPQFVPQKKTEVKVPLEELKRYEGTYEAGGQKIRFAVENGVLWGYPPSPQPKGELIGQGEGRFFALIDGAPPIRFVPSGDGPVNEVEIGGRKGKRVTDK